MDDDLDKDGTFDLRPALSPAVALRQSRRKRHDEQTMSYRRESGSWLTG
jgi:hypothetical protein